ncbi:MAG: hypothetical protein VYA66_04860 [SAR324 cluster bacterium]|nr:hypothetical protein [SAR324 cluster bacterium]
MSAEKPKKPTAAKKKPAATKHTATKAAATKHTAKKPAATKHTAKKPAATKHTAKKPAATKHTAPKAQLSTSDKVIRFFFGIIVFTALVSGGTYYMQSSLIVLQLLGLYAHWAFILILLPALSGLAQHLIASPARLIVAVLGSLASSAILYPIYADRFWAIPPSITDMIVFTLVIAGIGFTSSINPLDRHVHQRRARRRKKSSEKHDTHLHLEQYGGVVEKLLNSSVLRSIELILTVSSFIGAIWGTLSLGMSAMN